MRLLRVSERKNKRCHFCGSLDVKYALRVYDPTVSANEVCVCVCNKCALSHKED